MRVRDRGNGWNAVALRAVQVLRCFMWAPFELWCAVKRSNCVVPCKV